MSYTSDLTDKEWSIVEPLLLEYLLGKKRTCPLKWSYREIFNAVLYQLKNGCHWRDLPKDFPPYSTVYWHYKQWKESGLKVTAFTNRPTALLDLPKLTILPDNGYHPEAITKQLVNVYPKIMDKVQFELSPKPSVTAE